MTEQTGGPNRSHGPRTPEDDKTLFWAPIILAFALILGGVGVVGQTVGWLTLFLATAATVVVVGLIVISVNMKLYRQDETVDFDTADNRLLPHFDYIDPFDITETEELLGIVLETDDGEAEFCFMQAATTFTGGIAPQQQDWNSLLLLFWPIGFWFVTATTETTWSNMTETEKRQQAEMAATDRAEEVMWWLICLAFPSLLVYGWFQEDTWVSLWHVLGSYGASCGLLWLTLAFRCD